MQGVYYYFVLNVNICQHTSLGNLNIFQQPLCKCVYTAGALGFS